MRRKLTDNLPLFNVADEGGSAPAPAAESVLFPNEGGAETGDKSVEKPGNTGVEGGAETNQPAGDWKEYENDPAKSEAENAAAKAEHDKTKPAAADDTADKVPEDGKYDLKMPDGVELDADLATALGPDFKELGLTNAQAQKLVDKYTATMQARYEAHAAKPESQWAASAHNYFTENGTPDTWAEKAKADKEIGGANWDATVAASRRAVDVVGAGDPDLKNFLNASGAGNHPSLIRFMAKVGAMVKEDNPPAGGHEGKGKPADAAHVLFPNDAPKG